MGETPTPPPGPKLGKWVASAKEGISDSLSSGESFWEEVWRVENLDTKRCHNLPRVTKTLSGFYPYPLVLHVLVLGVASSWKYLQLSAKGFYGSRKVLPMPPYPGQTAWVGGHMSPESTFKMMKGDDGSFPQLLCPHIDPSKLCIFSTVYTCPQRDWAIAVHACSFMHPSLVSSCLSHVPTLSASWHWGC